MFDTENFETENTEMLGYLHWIDGLNYASMYKNFIFDDIMKTDILASLTERKIKTNSIYGKWEIIHISYAATVMEYL